MTGSRHPWRPEPPRRRVRVRGDGRAPAREAGAQDFQRWPVTAAMNIRLGRPDHPAAEEDLEPS
ncbi:hypothetical protein, partial [Streptomyces sp. NPDC007094]|uniref:hypothetical protein n=1 Tax=Streptomyces sp. NPDC007094 TaxID=3155359 RepID=UPI0033CFCEC1